MSSRGYSGYHRGRGGRGGGASHWQQQQQQEQYQEEITSCGNYDTSAGSSQSYMALRNYFNSVEGSNYGALKSLKGSTFTLSESVKLTFLAIQSDPFAPGSQICVACPCPFSLQKILLSDDITLAAPCRRVAAEDYILRSFHKAHHHQQRQGGNFYSGALQVLRPSQHVLERSTVRLVRTNNGSVEVLLYARVKLPGHGRRIDGRGAIRILYDELLSATTRGVVGLDETQLWHHVTCVHDQEHLRSELHNAGCVAFVANGAILPRDAGDSDRPLQNGAVPFTSPPSLQRTFTLPYSGIEITGMALPHGLTLIAGGGFHGKSTLLRALEVGVYNHTPDDGRVYVVVDPTAVKIRAEDRRSVHGVDISPFINNLPFKKQTTAFATSDASGSTSQAANIMEALELGSQLLLLDEDTCATNLMYRDALMQMLVPREQEPITPFVERVTDLIQHHAVSSIMVVGGSGQYFPFANVVLVMNAYQAQDCTESAKQIVATSMSSMQVETSMASTVSIFNPRVNRRFDGNETFATVRCRKGHEGTKVSAVGKDSIRFSEESIDLSMVEQIVEEGQVNAIAQCLAMLYDEGPAGVEAIRNKGKSLSSMYSCVGEKEPRRATFYSDFSMLIEGCDARQREARLELQTPSCYLPHGFTSVARRFEIGAALNRLRTLRTYAALVK
ncbi:ABC transporter [Trypanosoma melophagium]|uniref:ABC transporter n=1 Tax=Trypanosoma melophagium TaxID=715481 RepID=UPI00351A6794|nr:ABC transporter [Trypanosoma melophagium]